MEELESAAQFPDEGDPPRVLLQSLVRKESTEGTGPMDLDRLALLQQPGGYDRMGEAALSGLAGTCHPQHPTTACQAQPQQHELSVSPSGTGLGTRPSGSAAAGQWLGSGVVSRAAADAKAGSPGQGLGLGRQGPGASDHVAAAAFPDSTHTEAFDRGPACAAAAGAGAGPSHFSGLQEGAAAGQWLRPGPEGGAEDDGPFVGPPPPPPDLCGGDGGGGTGNGGDFTAMGCTCAPSAAAAAAAAEACHEWRMDGRPVEDVACPRDGVSGFSGDGGLSGTGGGSGDHVGHGAATAEPLERPFWQLPPRPSPHPAPSQPAWARAGRGSAVEAGHRGAGHSTASAAGGGGDASSGPPAGHEDPGAAGYSDDYDDDGADAPVYGTNLVPFGSDVDEEESDAAAAVTAASAGGGGGAAPSARGTHACGAAGPLFYPHRAGGTCAADEQGADSDEDGGGAAAVQPSRGPHARGYWSHHRPHGTVPFPYRPHGRGATLPLAPTRSHLGATGGGAAGAAASSAGASTSAATPAFASAAAPNGAAAALGMWRASLRPACCPEQVATDEWSEDGEEEADTTAEQFYDSEHPKDIQGIPWDRLQFNRPTYRDTRLRQYRNYTNVLPDDDQGAYRAELAPLCAAPRRGVTAGVAAGGGAGGGAPAACGPPFFAFVRNSRAVQSNIVHFQLRNLVWALSPNDVFVVHENCVNHWNPTARTVSEVLNLNGSGGGLDGGAGGAGGAGPGGGGRGGGGGASSRLMGLGRVQVSTLCVAGDLVAAGGFMGELVVRRLRGEPLEHEAGGQRRTRKGAGGGGGGGDGGGLQGKLLHCGRITTSDNGITNGLEIFSHAASGTVVMAANNDSQLRLFAAAAGEGALRPLASWPFDWAVNYATVRPNGPNGPDGGGGGGSPLAAVVGDDPATLLTDVHNGITVSRLHGHRDFSFAAAWHPGGTLLATGNQDTTALLWDVRRTDQPLTRLAGRMGAIRSLRFSPDGRFLAMSEPADFVHVYDVASGFLHCQEHDFFGEIAGVSFTPDSSTLFVGVSDLTYASLMQLERQRCDWM